MLTEQEIAFVSTSLSFWERLSADEKSLLLGGISPVHYHQGQRIHSGEQDCIGVLLIQHGSLRTYLLSDEGREVTLFRLSDDDVCVFSASCLLKNITFDVSIDAETDTDLLLVSSAVFARLIQQNVYVENFSYKLAIDRFSDVMWAMEQILFMSFDRRLAIFLIDESSKTSSDSVSLTHEQIAKYMGSAREVVSRMLKYFASEGIVALSRGGVKILDRARLRALT